MEKLKLSWNQEKKIFWDLVVKKKPKQTKILHQNQTNNRMKGKGKEEEDR